MSATLISTTSLTSSRFTKPETRKSQWAGLAPRDFTFRANEVLILKTSSSVFDQMIWACKATGRDAWEIALLNEIVTVALE